jgi:hypothetical protein
MKDFGKKVETLANVAIIVVALMIVAALGRQYLLPPGRNPPQRAAPAKVPASGTPVALADVDWRGNGRTLLLVVSTACHFCTQSAPFYQRIVKEHGDVRLIALVPQPASEGQAYMKKLGLEVNDVRQVSFEGLGVGATPTLILVDGDGKVTNTWVGALKPDKENEVISRLRAEQSRL